MERFLKYTTQQEPAITASLVAAIILALISKFLNLTDDDLLILGPIAVIVAGVIIRAGVFSPFTHDADVEEALYTPVPDEPG